MWADEQRSWPHAVHLLAWRNPFSVQDTWLPEQVAFVSAMGNARANAYWEVGAGNRVPKCYCCTAPLNRMRGATLFPCCAPS